MSFLKPKAAKSTSENTNAGLITSQYGGTMNQGTGATNILGSLLTGQGDTGAATAGWDQYKQNAGYSNILRDLSRGITGQGAASGLLRSGSTANALITKGTELNSGMFNNYLGQLLGLGNLGLQAGGLVANVGQKSTSTGAGPSTAGAIASTVGGLASIFSDRRLKEDAVKIDELSDGLGLWSFRYLGGVKRFVGVMAHEVARLRPWALGPRIAGYQTVNMGAL